MITERAKPLAVQCVLYFVMAKMGGKSREEAITSFVHTALCKAWGDTLTVNNVYGFAAAGGYEM